MATPERQIEEDRTEADRPDERDEFSRFEDLARKLLRVPKQEIDAKREESRNGREDD